MYYENRTQGTQMHSQQTVFPHRPKNNENLYFTLEWQHTTKNMQH